MPELVEVCTHGMQTENPNLLGCFRWMGDVCHIYTLPRWVREQHEGGLDGYHRTLGHELDHCRIGLFHGEHKGVEMPLMPRLSSSFSGLAR